MRATATIDLEAVVMALVERQATQAIAEVEELELQWTRAIRISSDGQDPRPAIEYLERHLHRAYRGLKLPEIAMKGGRVLRQRRTEIGDYVKWLQHIVAIDDPEITSQFLFPGCVVVYGEDIITVDAGEQFECIWKDTWVKVGCQWKCLESIEEAIYSVPIKS